MRDLLVFAVYVLGYGALGSALGLAVAAWMRHPKQKLLKTFLFFAYLTLLFSLSGFRFGLRLLGAWDGPGVAVVFEILEWAAMASLIYFLPATMNYILGRQWSAVRIARVSVAAAIYLGSGVVSLAAASSTVPKIMGVLAFLLIVFFVVADAASGLPMIRDEATRVSLFLLYGVTFVFLPLAQVIPLIVGGYNRLLFLSTAIYHLILAICADVYLYRSLMYSPDDEEEEGKNFQASCEDAGLTKREAEIALLISQGYMYKEIGVLLDISPNTVGSHVGTIYRKTGTRSKVGMVNALKNPPDRSASS